jgi:tetratricopeptide (TPR) repeat protein
MSAPSNKQAPGNDTGRHLWIYRLGLAVGIPVFLLLMLEMGLRLGGFGKPATFLIPDDKPGYLRTNPDFASLFLPGNFDLRPLNFRVAAHKAPNTVRIVVLGESAAQGIPVPSFAFAPQLRAQLRSRFPGKEFEVINTGIVAINSHVVYQIAREMARYEPDLFVVYMGNNEVVGPYGPGCAYLSQMPPLWVIRASVFVRSTRTGQLLGSLIGRLSPRGRGPRQWGGMSMFVDNAVAGDDPRLETVYANFESNLRGIVDAASGAGAKTLLCTVVCNLKDCPPFLSVHSPGLSAKDLASWQSLFDSGRLDWRLGDNVGARSRLKEALRIDPHFADTQFLLGTLDDVSGNTADARSHFIEALHWDALRFRPDPRINQIVRKVALEGRVGVGIVDSAVEMGSDPESKGEPSGRGILFEHVHFDWSGNYRLALLMARGCSVALFGGYAGAQGWLDGDACAKALAYTPHERLPLLLRIDVLTRKPPFTNQLTHVVDEARMAREIDAALKRSREAGVVSEAEETAKAAIAMDPNDPALAGILEGIYLDEGAIEDALAQSRRAGELLPRDYAISADEASILIRLGRFGEAETILINAAKTGADLDLLAPVLVDLWTKTKRFPDGEKIIGEAMARRPDDPRLRLFRAELLRASGDEAGAVREFRASLAADPSSVEALDGLVGVLEATGRHEEALQDSLAAADGQPGNQANCLRAEKALDQAGDYEGSLRELETAERSDPVNATFELTLALKLYESRRMDEVLEHLALARTLSLDEGNPAVTDSILSLIGKMQREAAFRKNPG